MAEKLMNNQQEVSLRTLVTKLFMRPKLFLICALVPPIMALLFTSLVPTEWRASTKILIRYSSTESPFLKGLIPDNRLLLSGSSSAELLKSTPTIAMMVDKVGVKGEDVYQKPMSVVTSKISAWFKSTPAASDADSASSNTAGIASAIKASLEGSASSSAKSSGVEILEKTSQVPDSMKGDELLSLEIRAFNREKVADMANGLANAFIDEYYRISAEDAHKSYLFLSDLVAQAEANAKAIENSSETNLALNAIPLAGVLEQTRQDSPFLANMSRQMTEMETTLNQTQQIYSSGSPKVVHLRNEISQLKQAIKKQERLDSSKQVLEQLKVRKYQAYNTENLYKNRLIPISIVEPASTPGASKSKVIMKYVLSGGIALVLGTILGVSLVVLLNLTDPRLYLREDVQKLSHLPILSTLASLQKPYPIQLPFNHLLLNPSLDSDLLRILAYLSSTGRSVANANSKPSELASNTATTILLTSPTQGAGVSFLSLALASALSKNSKNSVLLIDANFNDKQLSHHLNTGNAAGMVESILDNAPLANFIFPHTKLHLDFIPAGDIHLRNGLGFYTEHIKQGLAQEQSHYDFIIIDSGAVLTSNEALMFGSIADHCLMILSAGFSRKGAFKSALDKFNDNHLPIDGIVLNRYKQLLPQFIYQNI